VRDIAAQTILIYLPFIDEVKLLRGTSNLARATTDFSSTRELGRGHDMFETSNSIVAVRNWDSAEDLYRGKGSFWMARIVYGSEIFTT